VDALPPLLASRSTWCSCWRTAPLSQDRPRLRRPHPPHWVLGERCFRLLEAALDVAAAKQRLCKAACLWKAVTGPAFVTSALRLGWVVSDYRHVTDDAGNQFDLARDPPALVKQMVAESVRRWQVARVDRAFSTLTSAAHCA